MRRVYLRIDSAGRLTAEVGEAGKPEERRVINSKEEFVRLLQANPDASGLIVSSSALDFPEEYTEDPNVIAMCDWIRNAG